MNTITEELVELTDIFPIRTRAWRRKKNAHKALHKKHISAYYCVNWDWYNNLHQYSKNKIHCSCPICKTKTKTKHQFYGLGKGRYGGYNWKPSEIKDWERMEYDLKEYKEEIA